MVAAIVAACGEKEPVKVDFSISASLIESGAEEATIPITIASPSRWVSESEGDWCTVIPPEGSATSSGGTTVNIHLDLNNGLARENSVTIIGDNGEKGVILVRQGHAEGEIAVSSDVIKVDRNKGYLDIPWEGPAEVTATSLSPWISVISTRDNTVSLALERTSSLVSRTGEVTLASTGVSERTIKIIQANGFSDMNFYNWVLGEYDYDDDGKISDYELSKVSELMVDPQGSILDGFELFKNAKSLTIPEIYEESSPQISLIIKGHPSLEEIWLGGDFGTQKRSRIKSIVIEDCPNLNKLYFLDAYDLEEAILCGNNALEEIIIKSSRGPLLSYTLKKLEITGCPAIKSIYLQGASLKEYTPWDSLRELREIRLENVSGIKCMDLRESLQLESIYFYNVKDMRRVLMSERATNTVKTYCIGPTVTYLPTSK